MNNPDVITTVAAVGLAATFNLILSEIFDISIATIFVAFMGCFIGLMARPSIEMPTKTKDIIKLIIKTCALLIFITMMTSWAVPFVTYLLPNIAQKTIAAFLGFGFMYKREMADTVFIFIGKWLSGKFK